MHTEQLWHEFLTMVQQDVGSRVVETWFKALVFERWDQDSATVYLSAPNSFVRDWVKRQYLSLCQTHFGRLFNVEKPHILFVNSPADLITVQQSVAMPMAPKKPAVTVPLVPTVQSKPARRSLRVTKNKTDYINKSYTFATFVEGPNNALSYAAAQAVAQNPGNQYNPLFIYGNSGLGKTHLMHAIGNAVNAQDANSRVLYQTADRFVTEFIHAIRCNNVHNFKKKYQNVDVLLIDDIQFFAKKEQTQEIFFHIFNLLYDARKQLVFSSDVFPQDMAGMSERLRSRLSWGLVTDMYAPSLEMKIAILKKKLFIQNSTVPENVLQYIASSIDSNIRDLEGALIRILAFASLTEQEIDIALAEKVLDRCRTSVSRDVDLKTVVAYVVKKYNMTVDLLCSKARNKELSHVRQVAMYLMKQVTNASLREIGIYLGGRDHSTVMHAIEKITEKMKQDADFNGEINQLHQAIIKQS